MDKLFLVVWNEENSQNKIFLGIFSDELEANDRGFYFTQGMNIGGVKGSYHKEVMELKASKRTRFFMKIFKVKIAFRVIVKTNAPIFLG